MGRKSLVNERRVLIIEALAEVIREVGYEAATLELVASKAGVQRTIIRHYFGNRDELISAALVHITDKYLQDYNALVESFPLEQSVPALIKYLFGGKFNHRHKDEAVIDALIAASGHSDIAKAAVLQMYRTFEETVSRLLSQAIAQAQPRRVKDVAYALVCLAEQHATMRALGHGASRDGAIKRSAYALVESLSASISPAPKGIGR